MDKETIKITKKFASKIRKKFDVKKIVLFGSRASGENFIESDFDFIIVSNDFYGTGFMERMSDVLKFWGEKFDVDALCYTLEEFERKKKFGIVKNALKGGVAL